MSYGMGRKQWRERVIPSKSPSYAVFKTRELTRGRTEWLAQPTASAVA